MKRLMKKQPTLALFRTLALSAVSVVGGGCITGASQEPDYFVLGSIPGESPAETDFLQGGSFHLGQPEIPSYLEDNRIVSRTSETQINYAEFDHWSETLDLGISRVVANNLVSDLGTLNYSYYPNRERANQYQISITVEKFESLPSGEVIFEGTWRLSFDREEKIIDSIKESVPVKGLGYTGKVKAMNLALRRISDRIAVRLKKYLKEESASVEP